MTRAVGETLKEPEQECHSDVKTLSNSFDCY